jgi:ketose-bisphosphate aldolase
MIKKNKDLKYFFKKAEKEKWAIGQFNFSTLEQLKGILEAGKKLNSPLILGTSQKESQFIGLEQAVMLIKFWRKKINLPIFLNLDHSKSLSYAKEAIKLGYDAVLFDGSELPINQNIKITQKLVKYAHKKNVIIEGEIDVVGGSFTDPKLARNFIEKTKIDSFAINIGTSHGMKELEKNYQGIDFQRLKEIKKQVGNTYLVLHGGSGVIEKEIKMAIKLGIVKININTELRMAYTNTLREELKKDSKEMIPYKYMPKAIEAVQNIVEEKIKLFGSVNKI